MQTVFQAIIFTLFFLPTTLLASQEPPQKQLLLLNSYHQKMTWVTNVSQAVMDVLQPAENNIIIHIENMATKRFFSAAYLESLQQMLATKYRHISFDLILSSDNNAFDFLKRYRDQLFPQVPVVFCGVNHFQPELLDGFNAVTGVAEIFSAQETVQTALRLHPGTKQLFVINDYLKTGRAWEESIREELQVFSQSLDITYAKNLPITELQKVITALPKHTIVLLGGYFADAEGTSFTYEKIGRLLSQQSPNPVHALLEFNLGGGVVGGKMISGYYQGEQMAMMGQRILSGERPESIPVLMQGANRYLYDYRQLQRFAIQETALPKGSVIRYLPDTFYTRNKTLVWLVVVVLLLQSFTIVLLLIHRRHRRRAELTLLETQRTLERRVEERTSSLKESELKYRNLYDTAMVGLFRTSLCGTKIIEANPALATMFRYDSVAEMQASFSPRNAYVDIKQRKEMLGLLKQFGKVEQFEFTARRRDGLERVMMLNATLYPEQKLLAGSVVDITERKVSEQAILDVSHRLELAAQAGGIGVWEWNIHDNQLYWDKRMFQIFQVKPSEFSNSVTDWSRCVLAEDLAQTQEKLQQSIEGDTGFDAEFRIVWPNGQHRAIRAAALLERDSHHQPLRMIGINWDITENKQKEHELQQAKEAADLANQAKTIFLAHMSHEIRTPLNAILGMGELLQETKLEADQKRYLATSCKASESLLALVNDILDLSKIEAGQMVLATTAMNLHTLVEEIVDIQQGTAHEKGIPITLTTADNLPSIVSGDPDRLRQVLLNLLSNAIKFTHSGGVKMTVKMAEDDRVMFCVTDSGIGIDADRLEEIFEPFVQADPSTTRRFGGTGLGLTICKKLIDAMGGSIAVESQLNQGSTFKVYVPLPATDAPTSNRPNLPASKQQPHSGQDGAAILLVDDAAENLMVIEGFLNKTAHSITTAENGQEAYQLFKSKTFDLVLMDMLMPVMDGYEATKQIRAWEQQQGKPKIPIIALTAQALKEDLDKALTAGCNFHLTKPVRKKLLITTINQFFSPKP